MEEKEKKKLPVIDSTEIPESLDCTTCFLPMQYQKKEEGKFIWQCFRCGKKYFVYTENVNINDKSTEIPIGVSCRTCDRLDCSQRAFPPLHKKFDIDINTRGVSVYVTDENSQGKS